MLSPVKRVGKAYEFVRKNPALQHVTFWLLVMPIFLNELCTHLVKTVKPLGDGDLLGSPLFIGFLLLLLLWLLINSWGTASILVVAKRLLGSPAGRNRTSLRAVLSEGAGYVPRLLITDIMRSCTAILLFLPAGLVGAILLWNDTNPLIAIPVALLISLVGWIYLLRTSFFGVIVVGKSVAFRAALHQSRVLVKGRTLAVAIQICVMAILVFTPSILFEAITSPFLPSDTLSLALLCLDAAGSMLKGFASLLLIICLVLFYAELRTPLMKITSLPKKRATKAKK